MRVSLDLRLPDGRLEIHWKGLCLPYAVFDKLQRVSHAAIIENKRLGEVLAWIKERQDAQPVPSGTASAINPRASFSAQPHCCDRDPGPHRAGSGCLAEPCPAGAPSHRTAEPAQQHSACGIPPTSPGRGRTSGATLCSVPPPSARDQSLCRPS